MVKVFSVHKLHCKVQRYVISPIIAAGSTKFTKYRRRISTNLASVQTRVAARRDHTRSMRRAMSDAMATSGDRRFPRWRCVPESGATRGSGWTRDWPRLNAFDVL